MRKPTSFAVVASLISLLLPYVADSQTAAQKKSDTIRLQSTEVSVDAVVVDRRSRLVGDLTAQDFEVYEDGVLQEIASFRVVRGAATKVARASSSQPAPGSQEAVEEAKPAAVRELPNLTIVLLDYSTTKFEHQRLIQNASIKYVEQRLQPNDLMAVFILGSGLKLLSDFTNDISKLTAALKTADAAGSAMATDRATLNATIDAGQAAQVQFQNFNNAVEGGAISGPDAPAAAAELARSISGLGTAIIAQHLASLDVALRSGLDRRQSLGVLSAIRAIAAGVKGIEGRKTLLLFSEGFVVGPTVEDEFHSVIGLANKSQLAVYCIESQGLETRELSGNLVPRDELTSAVANSLENKSPRGGETVFDRARQVGRDIQDSVLRHLAESTGGLLIRNTNDLGIGLDRIDQEMRRYYVLTYRPKNDKLDGRFRQIRVSVKKPDLSVRARSGYYAMPAGFELLNPAEYQLIEQARSAADSAKMPMFLRIAGFQEGSQRYRVPVILEIPSDSIRFDSTEGKRSALLLIVGLVRDQAGNLVRRFGGTVPVRVSDAEFDVLKRGAVSFVNHIQLPAGGYYSVDVVVKDLVSGLVASRQQAMYLSRPEPSLALSTILLAREVGKSLDTASQFLTVQGVKIMPSARCQFRNGDNLIFYFDIYNPQHHGDNKKTDISIELALMLEGKLVNARLPRYHVSEHQGERTSPVSFARYLQLAGLAPGNYTLVVEVKDALGRQTARGQAAFSLVGARAE